MEGRLQRRPGSNAKKERENRKKLLTGKKKKNTLTHTGLLMEGVTAVARLSRTLQSYR
jgi:hypothetical protein